MAHRLLVGRESIDTDVQRDDEYVFRVVYQAQRRRRGRHLAATHIGVAVCLRGDRAVDAVRFSYLHFKPACSDGQVQLTPAETSIAADREAYGGDFVRTPTSATSRPRGGSARPSRTGLLLGLQDAGVDPVVAVDVAVDHGVRPLAARRERSTLTVLPLKTVPSKIFPGCL